MTIRGEVETAELGNIFQMVSGLHHRSLLILRPADEYETEHRLLIEADSVSLQSDPVASGHPGLLLARGLVDLQSYHDLHEKTRRAGIPVDEWLARSRSADHQLEDDARRLRHEESILDALSWASLVFRVEDAEEFSSRDAPQFRLDPLLLEAARRVDERGKLRTGLGALIPRRTDAEAELPEDRFSALERAVFDEIDGRRNAYQLAEATGVPLLDLALALERLLAADVVVPSRLEELRAAIPRLGRAGHLGAATRVAEAAVALAPDDADLHGELATLLERQGRPGPANVHDLQRADLLEAHGAREDLQRTLLACRKRIPTDFHVLKRLIAVIADDGVLDPDSIGGVLSDTRELATYFEEQGDLVAATALTRLVWRVDPENLSYGLELARRQEESGHIEEAVELLEHIAKQQGRAGRGGACRATYQDLIRLDPRHEARYERALRSVQKSQSQAAPAHGRRGAGRSGRRAAIAATMVCVFAVAVGAVASSGISESAAEVDLDQLTNPSEAEAQADKLQEMSASWPWSPSSIKAEDQVRKLREWAEQRRLELAAEDNAERRAEGERLLGARLTAEKAVRAGDLVGARATLKDALASDRPEHPWRAEIESFHNDLERFLTEADQLRARADRARLRGQLDRAYAAYYELVTSYPATPASEGFSLPVRVVVTPADTLLRTQDGREARGVIEVEVRPTESVTLEASHPSWGQERIQVRAIGPSRSFRHVLRSQIDRSVVLDSGLIALIPLESKSWLGVREDGQRLLIAPGADRPKIIEERPPLGEHHLAIRDGSRVCWIACMDSGTVLPPRGKVGGRLPLLPGERLVEGIGLGNRVIARTSTGRAIGVVIEGAEWGIGVPFPLAGEARRILRAGRYALAQLADGRVQWIAPDGTLGEAFPVGSAKFFEARDQDQVLVADDARAGVLAARSKRPVWDEDRTGQIYDLATCEEIRLELRVGGKLLVRDPDGMHEVDLPHGARSFDFVSRGLVIVRLEDDSALILEAPSWQPKGRLVPNAGTARPIGIARDEILFSVEPRLLGGFRRTR